MAGFCGILCMSRWILGVAFPAFVSSLVFFAYTGSPFLGRPLLAAFLFFVPIPFFSLRFPFAKRAVALLCWGFFSLYVVASQSEALGSISLGLPQEDVVILEGICDDDSAGTRNGGDVVRLRLRRCGGEDVRFASAKGLITIYADISVPLPYGTWISVRGSFVDPIFFAADELSVSYLSHFGEIRFVLMRRLRNLLRSRIKDPATRALSYMLLLGQSDNDAFPLKDMALQSGCSHILALSGMHLGFVASLGSCVAGRFFGYLAGKTVGLLFALAFVLLVGPKPSLIRAVLLYVFLMAIGRRRYARLFAWLCSLCVQMAVFPCSCKTLGFLLSHQAYGALVAFQTLAPLYHPYLRPLLRGALVVGFTASSTLLLLGSANLLSIPLSGPASFLVKLILCFSLLSLLPVAFFPWILERTEALLLLLFSFASHYEECAIDWRGYVVFLIILLTTFPLLGYAKVILRKVRKRSYDLEFQLRFPRGDQTVAGSSGLGHVQEVRSEFSDFSDDSLPDCR
jgi:competence protein ComEC